MCHSHMEMSGAEVCSALRTGTQLLVGDRAGLCHGI